MSSTKPYCRKAVTRDILGAICHSWEEANNFYLKKSASMLKKVLLTDDPNKGNTWTDNYGVKCSAPEDIIQLLETSLAKQSEGSLKVVTETFLNAVKLDDGDLIPWKQSKYLCDDYVQITTEAKCLDKMKSIQLVGNPAYGAAFESRNMYVGFLYVGRNTAYPKHAHDAEEYYQALCGHADWWYDNVDGGCFTPKAPHGSIFVHTPGTLHGLTTTEESLLALYCWTGNIDGKWWFDPQVVKDILGKVEFFDIYNISNPEKYYDDMAKVYENTVRMWGYRMPEMVVDMFCNTVENAKTRLPSSLKILDCGCGDGLVGVALNNAIKNTTFNCSVVGVDISQKMLDLAKNRDVYDGLQKVDLNANQLPFHDNSFDAVLCVGTSTYLEPEQSLLEWIRVVKIGGYILVTCKTAIWPRWEEFQNQLMQNGILGMVETSKNLPHLPNFPLRPEDESARIYAFDRLK